MLKTQKQTGDRGWYVIHTYSGYEDNVARNLKQRIESMDMQDLIFDVMVPTEKKIKIKSGKRTVIEEKILICFEESDKIKAQIDAENLKLKDEERRLNLKTLIYLLNL